MMANDRRHLSTFMLDVYWASGSAANAAVEEHLARCARCQGYLRTLHAFERAPRPTALLIDPATTSLSRARSRASRGRRTLAALGVTVLAASLALFLLRARSITNDGYVGIKGAPAVQVLVHRGSTTHVWDGRSAVRPGDALALRVACDVSEHVAVASPGAVDWELLSAAACPRLGDVLPFTLVVDDHRGDERLAVVLSRSEMDVRSLRTAIAEAPRTKDVWVVRFVLPKETDR